jgi:hypothetical protein
MTEQPHAGRLRRPRRSPWGCNRPSNEIEHLVVCVTDESGNEVFRTKVMNLQHPTTADEMLSAARFKAS